MNVCQLLLARIQRCSWRRFRFRARTQSYRIVNGVMLYRSLRDVGRISLEEGWVIAVPQSLIPKVIETFHGDHASGHGGVRNTTLAIR